MKNSPHRSSSLSRLGRSTSSLQSRHLQPGPSDRRQLRFETLEDRRLLAALVGIDFDVFGDIGQSPPRPDNWNVGDFSLADSGTLTLTLNFLRDETGAVSTIDLAVATSVGPPNDGGTLDFLPGESIIASTIPTRSAGEPTLEDLGGNLFVVGTGETITATYSNLTPGFTYELYVFGLEGDGQSSAQSVVISGAAAFAQSPTSTGTLSNLFVNGQVGTNVPLEDLAVTATADAAGEIEIVVTATGASASIGGLAIEEFGYVVNDTGDVDDLDAGNGVTTLREAINLANANPGADTIFFDDAVFTGGANSRIRLGGTELGVTETLTIDGSTGVDVVITADAAGDDLLVAGTFITDVAASFGGTAGAPDDRLDDNSRVLNFSAFSGDLTLSNLTVTGGRTTGDFANGGGISTSSGAVTLTSSTVSGNSTAGDNTYGGGISTSSGAVTLTSSTVSGNSTAGSSANGGGISTSSGAVTLTSSTVSGNSTAGSSANGGGISTSSGAVTLTNSTVSGNSTAGDNTYGGGIRTGSGSVTLTSSTVSGNSTAGDNSNGGGISTSSGAVTLTSSTVSGNEAAGVGGGIFVFNTNDDQALTIENSIVAGNTDNGTAPDLRPDPFSVLTINHSLIGDTTGSGITVVTGTGNVLNQDPLLGPLADNGGPTLPNGAVIQTHALLLGSPAIDAGATPVAFYQFEETAGATTAVDLFGGHPGTYLNGSTPAQPGAPVLGGSAAQFDGTDDFISVANDFDNLVGSAYSIEFWVNSAGGKKQSLVSLTDDQPFPGHAVLVEINADNTLRFLNRIPAGVAGGDDLLSTQTITPGEWHHVAVVREGANMRIYIDGVEDANSLSNASGALPDNLTLAIGVLDDTQLTRFFDGLLDELAIHNRALSAGEVALHAAQGIVDQRGFARVLGNAIDIGAFEAEALSLIVSTTDDVSDSVFSPGNLSLREAIEIANNAFGANTITFDATVFTGGASSLIRLGGTELTVSETLTIDGSTGVDVVITADAAGDDLLVAGTFITDVAASFGGTAGALDDLLDDNSRVLNFSDFSGDLTLSNLTVTGGRATEIEAIGGGIRFRSAGTLTLASSTLSGNSTAGDNANGGGIYTSSGTVTLTNSTLSGNSTAGGGAGGGGIGTFSGTVTLTSSTVSGNSTTGDYSGGGGIRTSSGSVTLTNSTLSGNNTAGDFSYGGGIRTGSGSVTLTSSTVSGNSTAGGGAGGGGIYTFSGEVTLTSSTVSGNSTAENDAYGGGISTFSGEVTLTSSTVSGNEAAAAGGGIFVSNSISTPILTIENSILAGNTDNGTAPDLRPDSNSVLTINHSLIGVADNIVQTITGNVGNQTGTAASPLNPLLGPLGDNGGPNQTHALLPGSTAIDAGSSAELFDQRGESRNVGGVDIGAYEAQIVPSADFDTDGDVDGFDFLLWQRGFGTSNAQRADGNSDDDTDTDASDLAAWTVSFGQPQPPLLLAVQSEAVATSGQPAVGREVLVDAVLSLDLFSPIEFGDSETDTGDNALGLTTAAPTPATSSELSQLVPAKADAIEYEADSPTDDTAHGTDQPWLDEELLGRVFG